MKKYTKEELKGKFLIASNTVADGDICMMEGEEGDKDYSPILFDSEDEAFAEIFDSNLAMLQSHRDSKMLGECNPGVTKKMIAEMEKINDSTTRSFKKDVKAMREFMDKFPQCDDSGEWVVPADEFIMNRKAFVWVEDNKLKGTIEGKKLTEL